MKTKKEILEKYKQLKKQTSDKIRFCEEHNFLEEVRILKIYRGIYEEAVWDIEELEELNIV